MIGLYDFLKINTLKISIHLNIHENSYFFAFCANDQNSPRVAEPTRASK